MAGSIDRQEDRLAPRQIRMALSGGAFTAWFTLFTVRAFAIAFAILGVLLFVLPLAMGLSHGPDISKGIGALLSFDVKKIAAMGQEGLAAAGAVLGLGGLILTLVLGALAGLIHTRGAKAIMVQPLAPVQAGGFIITTDGIYTQPPRRTVRGVGGYRLHPWRALAWGRGADEKADRADGKAGRAGRIGRIELFRGSTRLLLRVESGDFARVHGAIRANLAPEGGGGDQGETRSAANSPSHAPASAPARTLANSPTRRRALRWLAAAVAIGLLLVADLAAAQRFDRLTKGKPGDQACDVDGRSLAAFTSFTVMIPDVTATALQYNSFLMSRSSGLPSMPPPGTVYKPQTSLIPVFPRPRPFLVIEEGKVVQEYCELHGFLYAIVHPLRAITTAWPAAKAAMKDRGFTGAIDAYGTIAYAADIWLLMVGIVIAAAAPRTYVFRQ